jgi:hypothetical protein
MPAEKQSIFAFLNVSEIILLQNYLLLDNKDGQYMSLFSERARSDWQQM